MERGDFLLSNVDKRVVQMEFDNKQFEKDMQATVKSLRNFEKDINSIGGSGKAFDGLSKGLADVKANVGKFNLAPISDAFDKVKVTISGWEMAAMAAITRVVDGAMSAAKNLANSLTVAPISQGFEEYELKMNSIQTMLLGAQAIDPSVNLDKVNRKLDELNTYADRTIYSFSDMTQNIGKFINAGVGLDDAVSAIQGVSNVAAISGANANEASRAMYNFAQALSSGSIRLIDWKSIENANMATVEFKQQLLDTALALGTVVKEGDYYVSTTTDANGKVSELFNSTMKFNDSLSAQWMTSEVLIKTLQKYTDETTELGQKAFDAATKVKTFHQLIDTLKEAVGSGWAQTWEVLFGNFDEAKELWTTINNVVGGFIDRQAKARNEMLENWKEMGGRATLITALTNAFQNAANAIRPVKEAFQNIFPPLSANKLISLTRDFSAFTYRLELTEDELNETREVFKSVFSVIKNTISPLSKAWKDAFPSGTIGGFIKRFVSLIGSIVKSASDLFNSLTNNGEVIRQVAYVGFTVIRTAIKLLSGLFAVAKNVINFFSPVATFISKIIGYLSTLVLSIFDVFRSSSKLRDALSKLKDAIVRLLSPLRDGMIKAFNALAPHLESFKKWAEDASKWVAEKLTNGIGILVGWIDNLTNKMNNSESGFSKIASGAQTASDKLKTYKDRVKEATGAVVESIKNNSVVSAIWEKVQSFFSTIWGYIKSFASGVKGFFDQIFNGFRQRGPGGGIGEVIKTLAKSIGDGIKTLIDAAGPAKDSLLKLFGANNILDLIQKFISFFLQIKMGQFLGSVTKFFSSVSEMFGNVAESINKISEAFQGMKKKSSSLLPFAISIALLASSLFILSKIPEDRIGQVAAVLGSMTILFAVIGVVVSKLMKNVENASKNFTSMALLIAAFSKTFISIALSMALLIAVIGKVNNPGAVGGAIAAISSITAILAAMVVLLAIFGKENLRPNTILSYAVLVKAMGSAVKSIAVVIGLLSLFDPNKVSNSAKVVAVISIVLGAIVGILSSSEFGSLSSGQIAARTLMIKAFGSAIKSIAVIIGILSLFDQGKLWSAMGIVTAISGVLGGLMLITKALGENTGLRIQKMAKSMLIMSASIAIFAFVIRKLAKLDPGSLIFILSSLVVALASFGGVLIGMTHFARPIHILSDAFLRFGAAAGLFGAGVYLIVRAVEKMTALGPQGIQTMTDMITALVSNAPKWISMLISGLIEALAQFIPSIAKALVKMLVSVIQTMTESTSLIIGAIVNLFKAIKDALASYSNEFDIKDLFWAIQSIALIAGLIFVLQIIASDFGAAMKGIALMTMVLGALVGSLILINQFTNPESTIKILAGMAAALVSLAGVFGVIGAVSVAMSKIAERSTGAGIKGMLIAIGGFVVFIAAMLGIMALIGFIANNVEGTMDNLNSAITVMSKLGQALGNFFGSIVSSMAGMVNQESIATLLALVPLILALEPLTLALPVLALFVGAIGEFATAIDNIAGEGHAVQIIQNASDILAVLGEALGLFIGNFVNGILTGLSKGFSALLVTFADGLSDFMTHIQPFIEGLNSINGTTLEKAGQLTLIMLEMCGAELIAGLTNFLSFITGGKMSLVTFAQELAMMAPYLVKFSDTLVEGKFNSDISEKAANVALMLANFANSIPRQGGLWGALAGDLVDIIKFSKQLPDLGENLVSFSKKLTEGNFNAYSTEKAASAAKMLAEMANSLPREGGLWQALVGELKDMKTFGTELSSLGESLVAFSISIKDLDDSQVKKIGSAAEAIKLLTDAANTMPTGGGVWQKLVGEQTKLDDFGSQMEGLGTGLVAFAKSTSSLTEEQITSINSVVPVIKTLAEVSSIISESKSGGYISKWFGDSKEDLQSFSEKVPLLGEGITGFAQNVSAITDVNKVKGSAVAMKDLADAFASMKDFNASSAEEFKKAVNNLSDLTFDTIESDFLTRTDNIITAAKKLITEIGNAFVEKRTDLETNVETGLSAIGSAIDLTIPTVISKMNTLISKMISATYDYNSTDPSRTNTFYAAGVNAVLGFIRGLESRIAEVQNAGDRLGAAALSGTKKALDEHSPSKAYADDAAYNAVIGFVRGFANRNYMAFNAGEDLGQNALNGTKGIISKISNVLNSDMDLRPVISPVLDLSDVSSKSSYIGGMLNAGSTINMANGAYRLMEQGRALQIEARAIQNGSPDVVAAVNNLTKRMDSMEEAILNRPIDLDGVRVSKKLAPNMDKELGRRSYYSKRGN